MTGGTLEGGIAANANLVNLLDNGSTPVAAFGHRAATNNMFGTDISVESFADPDSGGTNFSPDAAPAFSLGQIVNQLRTQWSGAYEGTYRGWFSSNVSYSMPDSYPTNAAYGGESQLTIMSTVMKNTARLGFELWDDAIAINLNKSVNNTAANITMNLAGITSGGGTYASATFSTTPSAWLPPNLR